MENYIGNSAQKHCKLSVYSSESGNFSIGSPGIECKPGIYVSVEEIENLTQMIKATLELKGKFPETSLNIFENFKNMVQILCLDYSDYHSISNPIFSPTLKKPKDIWDKVFENQEIGCYITGDECKDICSIVTQYIKDSGIKDLEVKIKQMEESLVSCKLTIKSLESTLKSKNKEINALYDELKDFQRLSPQRNLNQARFIDSETTTYDDNELSIIQQ